MWQGIGVYYGAILPGGLTLRRQLTGGPAEGNWARLSFAASVTEEISIAFQTRERRLSPRLGFSLSAQAYLFDDQRFYELGGRVGGGFVPIEQNRYSVAPTFTLSADSRLSFSFGPVFRYTESHFDLDDRPASNRPSNEVVSDAWLDGPAPYGFGGFRQLGAQARLSLSGSVLGLSPGAASLTVGASTFPAMLDVAEPFGEVHGEARGAIPFNAPGNPVLAIRVGGKKLWGAVPVHEAAFLGGGYSLRGVPSRSLAGDAAVHAGAELRFEVGSATILKRQVRFGFLGLADVGRVFYNGVTPHGWLTDVGGGLWLEPLGLGKALTAGVVRGPLGTRFFVGAGM